ncbi:DUF2256 domain-containing protein [Flagellatimonas centrodinii]|uniref:DUF2256 domain-containing protein n=1 Tax=Flagellatimonas centrodinii TaxID=2806210 RepID=UPI003450016C
MAHHKPNLPTKTCPVCSRPFTWRKKWARVWDDVKYCSDACRSRRATVETHAPPDRPARGPARPR